MAVMRCDRGGQWRLQRTVTNHDHATTRSSRISTNICTSTKSTVDDKWFNRSTNGTLCAGAGSSSSLLDSGSELSNTYRTALRSWTKSNIHIGVHIATHEESLPMLPSHFRLNSTGRTSNEANAQATSKNTRTRSFPFFFHKKNINQRN